MAHFLCSRLNPATARGPGRRWGGLDLAILPLDDDLPERFVRLAVRDEGEVVLVVEDEPMVRLLARRVLEANRYTVYQAPNARPRWSS